MKRMEKTVAVVPKTVCLENDLLVMYVVTQAHNCTSLGAQSRHCCVQDDDETSPGSWMQDEFRSPPQRSGSEGAPLRLQAQIPRTVTESKLRRQSSSPQRRGELPPMAGVRTLIFSDLRRTSVFVSSLTIRLLFARTGLKPKNSENVICEKDPFRWRNTSQPVLKRPAAQLSHPRSAENAPLRSKCHRHLPSHCQAHPHNNNSS